VFLFACSSISEPVTALVQEIRAFYHMPRDEVSVHLQFASGNFCWYVAMGCRSGNSDHRVP